MEQVQEAIRLGASLAGEYHLSPEKNSFTAAHPDAYFFGVFCAFTGRPLPERDEARKSGQAPSAHAYEVLKLGFADASNALGKPVLIYSRKEEPPKKKLKLPEFEFKDKLVQHGKPTTLFMMLLIVGLAVLLFLVQILTQGRQVGTTPLPGQGQGQERPANQPASDVDQSI